MAQYFFHIRDDDYFIRDDEGMEFADLEAARNEAIESVRDLVAEHIKSRTVTVNFRIDMYDDTGSLVFVAHMAEALQPLILLTPEL